LVDRAGRPGEHPAEDRVVPIEIRREGVSSTTGSEGGKARLRGCGKW